MDKYIVDFFSHNVLTMYIVMQALKGFAIIHPGVTDNKIVTLILTVYNSIKTGVVPKTIDCSDLAEKEDK